MTDSMEALLWFGVALVIMVLQTFILSETTPPGNLTDLIDISVPTLKGACLKGILSD
jgi:hypothetical protein